MKQTYLDCKTYTDSGVVKRVITSQNGQTSTEEVRFSTAFVRPNRFRFEYHSSFAVQGNLLGPMQPDRFIVWQQGTKVQSWWDVEPGVHNEPSLGMAIAKATGVSGGSAHTVPVLLLPEEVGGSSLTELKDPTRLEDVKLGKDVCFRIQGRFAGDPMTLWIDSTTFLLRKIDSGHVFNDFRSEETTTYETPAINGQVSDAQLAFAAPSQK